MNKLLLTLMLGLMLTTVLSSTIMAEPEGVILVSNSTETINATPASSITTAGGSFTTLILNGTFQNPRWKAYVGNISGALTLDDANNLSIYDWDLTVITGEVYASRSNSITWANIGCLDNTTLGAEETAINFDTTKIDSINNTFNGTTHAGFQVAGTNIPASNCRALATFVNDARQTPTEDADFQEILLDDDSTIIYTALLEQDAQGYDSSKTFDFQMILPDDETAGVDTTYYFYAELG